MNYLYVLKSTAHKWNYIGVTKYLRKRFEENNTGKVRSTKPYHQFKLVYYEAYLEYRTARKREISLKTHGQEKKILFRRLGLYS